MTNTNQTPAAHRELASLIDAGVIGRAAIVALVLGSVLSLANQSGAVFGGDAVQVLPLVLVYLIPFIVVTISQVLGIRRALLDARRPQAAVALRDTFLGTAISHGIPRRSLLVGLIVGCVNMSIVVSAALLDRGDLAAIPVVSVAQAFVLPTLFGLLSQAISYRRAALALDRPHGAEPQPLSV